MRWRRLDGLDAFLSSSGWVDSFVGAIGVAGVVAVVAASASGCGHDAGGAPVGEPVACAPAPTRPVPWPATTAALTSALQADGYDVVAGSMRFFRVDDCRGLADCFGNNPSSPYGFYCLPTPAGAAIADTPLQKICPAATTPTWRLREDEAIVLLGRTPPRARYVGFRSYVNGRTLDGGARKTLFASLGDTLNPLTLSTSGTPCAAAGDPWDADLAVITTADRGLERQLRERLAAVGVPGSIVDTDAIPREVVRMGLGPEADDLTMLFRVALFDDPAAGEAWMSAPPVTVLRITPRTPVAIAPFAVPTLRPRGTGTTEADLETPLRALADAVRAKMADAQLTETRMISIAPVGFRCLQAGENCLGDNQDTLYVASAPHPIDDPARTCSDFVIGVNHEATGKATYMNVSLYMTRKIMGVASVTGAALAGTAERWLAGNPKLYVWEFARDCAGRPACTTIPDGELGVPPGERLNYILRPYLEPATKTAPDAGEVLMPWVVEACR